MIYFDRIIVVFPVDFLCLIFNRATLRFEISDSVI